MINRERLKFQLATYIVRVCELRVRRLIRASHETNMRRRFLLCCCVLTRVFAHLTPGAVRCGQAVRRCRFVSCVRAVRLAFCEKLGANGVDGYRYVLKSVSRARVNGLITSLRFRVICAARVVGVCAVGIQSRLRCATRRECAAIFYACFLFSFSN